MNPKERETKLLQMNGMKMNDKGKIMSKKDTETKRREREQKAPSLKKGRKITWREKNEKHLGHMLPWPPFKYTGEELGGK